MNIWVTVWGTIEVTDAEIAAAGLEFRRRGKVERAFPKKNFKVLHDFLTLYTRDEG